MPPRRKALSNSHIGISSRVAANEAKLCSCCGQKPRHKFGAHCRRCMSRRKRFGIPDGVTLPRAYYKNELHEVARFVQKFAPSHPAVQAALKFFEEWMAQAVAGKPVPGKRSLVNLSRHNTPPRKMLKEVLAAWLYATRRSTPATRAPFLLANALLRCSSLEKTNEYHRADGTMVKSYRIPGYHEREDITRTIRKTLSPLMGNMIEWMRATEELRNKELTTRSKPFPVKTKQKPMPSAYRSAYYKKQMAKQRGDGWIDGRTSAGKAARQKILDLMNQGGGGI